ncbi:MAG TPA: IDEAL domain-containing protein [Candidatus Avamphibacillus intestinigallinarum]|nr:IDEAL domain-containing protein [Candidatus Avamphibacillus intestinigallinarum]
MKKQLNLNQYHRYQGKVLTAHKEIPYDIQLSTRLILDELCFNWNKAYFEREINRSIDEKNKAAFLALSKQYKHYIV